MAVQTRPRRPELDLVDRLPHKLLIGGRWVDARSGATFETHDPATGEMLATVAAGQREDIDAAVKAARQAYDEVWKGLSPAARGRLLIRLAELIEENVEEIAALETLDVGKPLTESLYVDMSIVGDVYRSLGTTLTRHGFEGILVGDEGGFGPRLHNNEQAVEMCLEAIEQAAYVPGKDAALALR